MAKKNRSVRTKVQAKPKAKASAVKSSRLRASLRTIKVHPHLALAIASLKRFSPEELEEVKTLASTEFADNSTGCWLSDSGGQQHCVNLPPAICTSKGGMSVPTKCPIT